jgi:hypothetical protein
LELPTGLIDGDSAAYEHCETILRAESKEVGLAAEENDGKLGVTVLEGEVNVAGRGGAAVGYLALDPDVLVFLLDLLTNAGNEIADAPYVALGGANRRPVIHRDFGSRLRLARDRRVAFRIDGAGTVSDGARTCGLNLR